MEEPQGEKIQAEQLLLGPCSQGFGLCKTSTSFKILYSYFSKKVLGH